MLQVRYVWIVILLYVSRGRSVYDEEDSSLKEFEERINRLRRSVGGGDVINDDEDVADVGSGNQPTPAGKSADVHTHVNAIESTCCTLGTKMASLGFGCSKSLLYMRPRQKLLAVGDIWNDLGSRISNRTTNMYPQFRRCMLKETRQLLKCCMVVGRNRGQHANRDIKSRVRYHEHSQRFGYNRRFDNSLNRYKNRGPPCRFGRCIQTSYKYSNRRRGLANRRRGLGGFRV